MTVRFMKGTSIAELEREMQQVPGFRPRKSGFIRSRQAGETAGIGSCRYVNVWRAEKEQGRDGHLYTAADEENAFCILSDFTQTVDRGAAGISPDGPGREAPGGRGERDYAF